MFWLVLCRVGPEWDHADEARRHFRAGILSLTALPGVLLPHVYGNRGVWSTAWSRFPSRLPHLCWYVLVCVFYTCDSYLADRLLVYHLPETNTCLIMMASHLQCCSWFAGWLEKNTSHWPLIVHWQNTLLFWKHEGTDIRVLCGTRNFQKYTCSMQKGASSQKSDCILLQNKPWQKVVTHYPTTH